MFDRLGVVIFPNSAGNEETMMDLAIEVEAFDIETDELNHTFFCKDTALSEVAENLEKKLGDSELAKLIWKPKTLVGVSSDQKRSAIKLLDALENDDDVQSVHINAIFNE